MVTVHIYILYPLLKYKRLGVKSAAEAVIHMILSTTHQQYRQYTHAHALTSAKLPISSVSTGTCTDVTSFSVRACGLLMT